MKTTKCPRCGAATVTANSGSGVELELEKAKKGTKPREVAAFVVKGGIAWKTDRWDEDELYVPHRVGCR